MTTFKAELFIFTIQKPVHSSQLEFSPSSYGKIYRVKFVSEKDSEKNFSITPISSYTYSNHWNLSGSHS